MKKTLLNLSISIISSILCSIIIAFILSLLKVNNVLNSQSVDVIINVLTVIMFFVMGLLFSILQKKRGLLNALLITLVYLFIFFITQTLFPKDINYLTLIFRILAIIFGSIFGVNLISKNDQIN